MGMSSTCVLLYAMPSFQGCMPCICLISVVTSTSTQSRPRNVSDFKDSDFSKSCDFYKICPCSSHHNSLHIASFRACNISKCSSRDALHFVTLHHIHFSPSWCPNLWCKSVSCCYLLLLTRTWWFAIFLHLICAFYGHELYMCFVVCHAIFPGMYAMYLFDLCGD